MRTLEDVLEDLSIGLFQPPKKYYEFCEWEDAVNGGYTNSIKESHRDIESRTESDCYDSHIYNVSTLKHVSSISNKRKVKPKPFNLPEAIENTPETDNIPTSKPPIGFAEIFSNVNWRISARKMCKTIKSGLIAALPEDNQIRATLSSPHGDAITMAILGIVGPMVTDSPKIKRLAEEMKIGAAELFMSDTVDLIVGIATLMLTSPSGDIAKIMEALPEVHESLSEIETQELTTVDVKSVTHT